MFDERVEHWRPFLYFCCPGTQQGFALNGTQKLLVHADDDIQWAKVFRSLRTLIVTLVNNIIKLTAT